MNISDAINLCISEFSREETLKALISIEKAINQENILKITKIIDFDLYPNYQSIIEFINNNLGMAHLEITEKCNSRCGYCIYGDQFEYEERKHGNKDMSEDIAFAGVDYLLNHSKTQDITTLGFYGGEPLLNFDLIKKTVDYAKKRSNNKIIYTITTNATQMTKGIADFLYKNNFSVLVSLDGPKDIHDSWRRDIYDRGTFDFTIKGLQTLLETFKTDKKKLGINCVYAPPYSVQKVDEIERFFKSLDQIDNDSRITITYPAYGSIPREVINKYELYMKIDFSLFEWARDNFLSDYSKNTSSHPLAKYIIERNILPLVKRHISDEPIKSAYLNGCCIPGGRKIYVTTAGKIRVCERISGAPDIGDIKKGINMATIKNTYLDDYSMKSLNKCAKCWMAKICSICYAQIFIDDKINIMKKHGICKRRLISTENYLSFLSLLLEINPNGLDYFEKYEIR
jgi:uncharacterized protein